MKQPGTVTCCTAITCLIFGGALAVTNPPEPSLSSFILVLSPIIGMGVAGMWYVLRINGWWSTKPDWVEVMGRVLGVCWIVLPLVLSSAFLF
jgi:hypothetical protein